MKRLIAFSLLAAVAQFSGGPLALLGRLLSQVGLFHEGDVGQRCCTRHRVAAECRQVVAGLERVGDFLTRDECAERKSAGDALGHGDEVRLDPVALDRKQPPRSTESGLDLVGDEQHIVRVQHLLGHLEVVSRRHDQASLTHQRFRDEIGDIVRGVEIDHIVVRRLVTVS